MKKYIEKQTLKVVRYIIELIMIVRDALKKYNVSKSIVQGIDVIKNRLLISRFNLVKQLIMDNNYILPAPSIVGGGAE